MPSKNIIVIGASAGGIEALKTLIGGLPGDFEGSIFIVLHTSPDSPGVLADILTRAGRLPALKATDGENIRPGYVYVAQPDHHLLIEDSKVRLTRGPKENRFRPAVDPLFRSAAQEYGPGVIGIILSGGLDDGSSGLWTVKHQGGIAIVQDPRDASVPSMPQSALHHVNVDYCLPVAEMAPLLTQLVKSSAQEKGVPQVSDELAIEVRIAKGAEAIEAGVRELGDPSPYACPECHGVLLRIKEGARPRFRCHTGHSYSIESLVAEITESVEDSLWSAIRSIEESVMLLDEISTQLGSHGHSENADIFSRKAEEARKRAEQVRRALLSHETLDHGPLLQSASQE